MVKFHRVFWENYKNLGARLVRKTSFTRTILNKDNLGILIAVCAILISGASFYATYLQAQAAEKQVKAMTMPLLRFTHSNYDEKRDAAIQLFTFENAGVGPALIRSVEFHYKDEFYQDLSGFIRSCCEAEAKTYSEFIKNLDFTQADITEGAYFSAPILDTIIPGQSNYPFYGMYYHENSAELWNAINRERFNLDVKVCYCSLLGTCFQTIKNNIIEEVKSCAAKN